MTDVVSRSVRFACTTCRTVALTPCTKHDEQVLTVSSRWRAPKRRDAKAWARVRAGQLLWDGAAVDRAAVRAAKRRRTAEAAARRRARLDPGERARP
ncbi:hypothetical protein ACFWGN_21020 [Oerskovia sp. NPDC060338]|uniref:hypothetical protein n=1 Tax=Oerskovia sp. NPDC060338 TaxID=3347100 RepID=UPI0036658BB6